MGVAFFSGFTHATPSVRSVPVKRKILALYDGTRFKDSADTFIHKLAEMPLNYLGLDVRYQDINKGLPAIDDLDDFRGVITWFGREVKNGNAWLHWADRASQAGLKFLILGDIGAKTDDTTLPLVNRFLARLGIRLENRYVSDTIGTRIIDLDKKIIGFERPLPEVMPPYTLFTATNSQTRVHLSVSPPRRTALPAGSMSFTDKKAVLVTSNSGGGFVQSSYALYYDNRLNRDKWLVNPFEYFKTVFGINQFPVPDVTTLSGRRMYFSHIDGDGWNNVSFIERYRKTLTLSSEVMLRELIAPYPDLPVTVALVTGDFDASIGGNPDAAKIARKIFALDQVEVGSHTHTHPFNWEFYDKYNRHLELEMVEKQAKNSSARGSGIIALLQGLLKKPTPRQKNIKYIAGSGDMPRAYMKKPFNTEQDITVSLKLAESLAPKGKTARLMQWSGNTRPFEAAIRAARLAGVYNMNGGDPRFDVEYSSIAYLSPLSRMVGNERQIYAAASNENYYTNDWTGPFYAFSNLVKTLENTENPRRLKPFNLYYHTYSAERQASLKAVKSHLERARHGRYTPVPASEYAAIADSFFKVEIRQINDHSWTIHNRGHLQTLRFDNAVKLEVDWRNSRGLIGSTRHQNALYIALDARRKSPLVVLKHIPNTRRGKTYSVEKSPRPVLNDSRWKIDNLTYDQSGFRFRAQGFGQGDMSWRGLKSGACSIIVKRGSRLLWKKTANIPRTGQLNFSIAADARTAPVYVSINYAPRMPGIERSLEH